MRFVLKDFFESKDLLEGALTTFHFESFLYGTASPLLSFSSGGDAVFNFVNPFDPLDPFVNFDGGEYSPALLENFIDLIDLVDSR